MSIISDICTISKEKIDFTAIFLLFRCDAKTDTEVYSPRYPFYCSLFRRHTDAEILRIRNAYRSQRPAVIAGIVAGQEFRLRANLC